MRNNPIAVASAEQARCGCAAPGAGYMQVCHGKRAPLLEQFEFVEDRSRWGYQFRYGLFKIAGNDMQLIAQAMQADLEVLYF